MSRRDFYVLFPDVENAQSLYKRLKEKGIKCTLAPTPREADKCCGVAVLYYEEEDRKSIETMVEETGVEILKFFEKENTDDTTRMKFC